jgi:dihydrofolate reductase
MLEIIIIAAMAENRVIGKNNAMPWSIKEDMAHFRQLTDGWPCIMGRKTWESLPKKPLPGRLNIVISSSVPKGELCPQENVIISPSLFAAIERCAAYEKVFICGGESVYRQALDLADKIELTLIRQKYDGDTFFPEIDPAHWTVINTVNFDTFSFITYIKNKKDIL